MASRFPTGHPAPETFADVLTGGFQWCWITNDFEAGVERLRGYGATFYDIGSTPVPLQFADRTAEPSVQYALGQLPGESWHVELLQTEHDETGIFASVLDGVAGPSTRFHHIGVVTPDLARVRSLLRREGLDFLCTGSNDQMSMGIVDLRQELGHLVEILEFKHRP